jgi:hypothetical protein
VKKLLIASAVLLVGCAAANADSITLTPPSQTLPVSTTAAIGASFVIDTTGGGYSLVLDVTAGPDNGESEIISINCPFSATPLMCVPGAPDDVFFTNDGTTGTDVISAYFASGSPATATATVTWGSATPTPEPSSGLLLGVALLSLGIFHCRGRGITKHVAA